MSALSTQGRTDVGSAFARCVARRFFCLEHGMFRWWRRGSTGAETDTEPNDDAECRADRRADAHAGADRDRIADADADATTRGPGNRKYCAAASQ